MQFGGKKCIRENIRTPLCSILAKIARDFKIFFEARRSCYSYEFLLGYLHRRKSSKRPNFFNGLLCRSTSLG